jgi:hypothetical protein
LAGYVTAHAVWCVSDGEVLIPILAYQSAEGELEMGRLLAETLQEGIQRGRQWLDLNPERVASGVLVYDGYLTFDTGRSDAIFVEVRVYTSPPGAFRIAVPYRPADHLEGFAVYAPRLLAWDGESAAAAALQQAFLQGVELHPQGADVWNGKPRNDPKNG